MRDVTIQNALITGVSLTMADHGCLTFWISIKWGCCWCNIGGWCIGHGYLNSKEFYAEKGDGLECLMRIMDTVGVSRWEDLPGNYLRFEDHGLGSTIDTIGNIIDDKWFDIRKFFEERYKEKTNE